MKAIFIIIVTLFIGVVPYKANKVPFDAFICTSELTVEKNRSFPLKRKIE